MYAFAWKPKWIFGHVLVVVLLATFIAAGFWQWSRHNWRSDLNHAISSRADQPVITFDELLTTSTSNDAEFRLVAVAGSFAGPDILIRSKALDGQPGCHVLTTMKTTGEAGVVVNRGWLPLQTCEATSPATYAPQSGHVEMVGRVRLSQERGNFGALDPATGVLAIMARVDVERIQQQSQLELANVYVEQVSRKEAGLPVVLPEPATDAGPHLGYTVQWFLFAAVAVIGYPLVLRRQARTQHTMPPDIS
jgi:cytochrome oxidase assembly protein ShyY1